MRKGNFFASFLIMISTFLMCIYYIKYINIDIFWIVSTLGVGIVSLFVLSGTLGGINDIASISYSLKHVRKIIYSLHVKDADNVWNTLRGQNYLFKNKYLDLDMSNYKREMERIEEEGMIYNQADIKDYINIERINGKVKKKYLDAISKIVILVLVLSSMIIVYFFAESILKYDITSSKDILNYYFVVKVIEKLIKPLVVLNVFIVGLLLEYVFFYKTSSAKLDNEYNLFVSDFEKYVMPNAKNDLINNVLYLQQISIQNTKRVIEESVVNTANQIKDIIIRNSESSNAIDRQVEGIGCALNKFNLSVEELKLSVQDQIESTKLSSDNQINAYKDILCSFENRLEGLVQEIKSNKSLDIVVEDSEDSKDVKEEVKKKKTSTKKTAEKTTEAKKTTKKAITKAKTTSKKSNPKSDVLEYNEEEQIVEPVVKKKRGRKSKAEKEAELKAALEAVIKEADNVVNKEEKTEIKLVNEEAVEEKIEVNIANEEAAEEKIEVNIANEEVVEEKIEVNIANEEAAEENTEVNIANEEVAEENVDDNTDIA